MARLSAVLLSLCLAIALPAFPCSRIGEISPKEMVAQADIIVRATAVQAAGESIRFRIEQVLKGHYTAKELDLAGTLTTEDDYNDLPVPYAMVRPTGRMGMCFTDDYKAGAQYLLILDRRPHLYTADWYALGPTNEQLRMPNDPWMQWVEKELRGSEAAESCH